MNSQPFNTMCEVKAQNEIRYISININYTTYFLYVK